MIKTFNDCVISKAELLSHGLTKDSNLSQVSWLNFIEKLGLRWYDTRIYFRDLNNVNSLNSLSSHDMEIIWTPRLGFTNALGPLQTETDRLSSGTVYIYI